MAIEVGMLGYRFMGKAHANALARLPMFFPDAPAVNRAVLIGRDEETLAEYAGRLGFDRTATDWRSVLDDVDVFYNLGPNHLHAEPSIDALQADTAVLCEKPLATSVAEATSMVTAAASTARPAACGFNYRFVPAIRHAKRLIADGAVGEVRHVRGRYLQDWLVDPTEPWSWRLDADLAGSGVLGDLGSHLVDLFRFLVGDDALAGSITAVDGDLRTFVEERPIPADAGDAGDVDETESESETGSRDATDRSGETAGTDESVDDSGSPTDPPETRPVTVDDAAVATLQFESGAVGTLEASRMATGHKNDLSIAVDGSEGSLRFSLERLNELEVLRADDRGYQTVLVTEETDPFVDHWWPPGHVLGWEHTFVHENAAFLTAVADDSSFEPSFADGLAAQRVLAAIEQSAESGDRIRIE